MKKGILKKWLTAEDEIKIGSGDSFYNLSKEDSLGEDGSAKMVLIEPKAYSEASDIIDHLKNRNTVVVNLKRVTNDQAKRIMDFVSGGIYALDGKIEKIGGGIFLCTPNNVNIEGNITDDVDGKDIHNNSEINLEW
jgi:FtsZ-interacting cell division protein YlmF